MKPGYKQTEVGVIPEEWEVSFIDKLCSEVFDCNHSTPVWTSTGSVVIRNQNIRDGKLDLSQPSYTDEIHFAERTRRAVPTFGDLVITREAPMGLVCMIPNGLKCCLGQRMVLLRPNHNTIETVYFLFALLSEFVQRSILVAGGTGSTVSNLRIPILKKLPIPLPPLPEQRAIAAALSDVDALLGGLERLITKKRDLKQAAMQQLLTGQTRLPGFDGAWEVKRLGEVGEISSAGVDKKINLDEVPVRLVNYLDVYRKDFIYSKDLNHWVTAPPPQARRCAVLKGDIFFTPTSETRDDIGISAVAMEDIPDAAYSYHVARLRLHEPWDLRFRTYIFKTRAFLEQAETLCDGNGTRYVISQGKFRNMTIQLPPLPEQIAIAAVLSDMDAELVALEQRRTKTRALKQAMMQELLTGRTRLIARGDAENAE
jgi:type I restriction enzyme, S subunit